MLECSTISFGAVLFLLPPPSPSLDNPSCSDIFVKQTLSCSMYLLVYHEVLKLAHDDKGHPGFDRTLQNLHSLSIPRVTRAVKDYIKWCNACRKNQQPVHKPYGSLHPILTPIIPHYTISIDFIVGLPGRKFDTLIVVVCKFPKRMTGIAGKTIYTAEKWANLLIICLAIGDWGLPYQIISNLILKGLTSKITYISFLSLMESFEAILPIGMSQSYLPWVPQIFLGHSSNSLSGAT